MSKMMDVQFPSMIAWKADFKDDNPFLISYKENETKSNLLWDFAGIKLPEDFLDMYEPFGIITEDSKKVFVGRWNDFVEVASPDQIVEVFTSMKKSA